MKSLKNSVLLAVLALPFVLYGAWQVHSATRLDAAAAPPPADAGPPPDKLAKESARAGAWAAEARKPVKVAWQYQPADPADKSPDADVAAAVKAAEARSADLADLDVFLSGAESRTFEGRLGKKYAEWAAERVGVKQAEEKVREWQRKPLAFKTAADATADAEAANALIDAYAARSQFSNRGKATVWRLETREQVLRALIELADRQYKAAIAATLPLDPKAGADAVASVAGVKGQLAALEAALRQAEDEKVGLDPEFRGALQARLVGGAEWTAREELLKLFAKPDLFANPTGAEEWLKQVSAQYEKTKNEDVKRIIRTKVQEFADAFVAKELQLDDKVLVKGSPVPRASVTIKFEETPGGQSKSEPLSTTADGLTEFNFVTKRPHNTEVRTATGTEEPDKLKPTEVSKAAVAYNEARAKVAARPAPRWTPDAVAALKKECEARTNLVDQLRKPGAGVAGPPERAGTRVLGLAAGMAACPELFGKGP